jgi:hypothetical protein
MEARIGISHFDRQLFGVIRLVGFLQGTFCLTTRYYILTDNSDLASG